MFSRRCRGGGGGGGGTLGSGGAPVVELGVAVDVAAADEGVPVLIWSWDADDVSLLNLSSMLTLALGTGFRRVKRD